MLQDCRQKFRAVLVEATLKLDEQVKRIGRAVDDSKPYWEARKAARQVRTRSMEEAGDEKAPPSHPRGRQTSECEGKLSSGLAARSLKGSARIYLKGAPSRDAYF